MKRDSLRYIFSETQRVREKDRDRAGQRSIVRGELERQD